MRIVMIASEANPFCKTGGLADVTYSLSKKLVEMGQEVSIIIPFYEMVKVKFSPNVRLIHTYIVNLGWRNQEARVYISHKDGINYYFVENDYYFDRPNLYGNDDDGERFAFFSLAAKELIYRLNEKPDIIHLHDWQTAMIPCLFKEDEYAKAYFDKTKFVLTVHNPAFQGFLNKDAISQLYNLPHHVFDSGTVRFQDRISTLKSGIIYSDIITTVSPTHRLELLSPEGGKGLHEIFSLREWDFVGILNGIDYQEFNPNTDLSIDKQYNLRNLVSAKQENKTKLYEQLGLVDHGQPLFSMVTRITWQKGFDLVFPVVEELVKLGCNFVILGSGEREYENRWQYLRDKYPQNIAIYIGYNDNLAHKIYAASDFFLMPSLFEPCGLGQMIAQRYGTLPIVRRTGGLRDSVINYDGNNLETANGYGFDDYSQYEINRTCLYAFEMYQDKVKHKKLMQNAYKTDNSWEKSTKEYLKIYKRLLAKKVTH